MTNTEGSSALALPDRQPLMMVPNIPTEGEIRSLALIADYAARSNFLRSTAPKSDQAQRQADAFFVIMYGRELGIPPMTALKMIYVLDGQPSAATQAIVALARRRGVDIDIPDPSTVIDSATVRIKRPGGEWKSYTFTMDMAKKMGLSGKKNWTGMQPVMLCWRAAGMGLRFEGGDYIGGLVPLEEMAPDTTVNEDGEPVGQIIVSKPEPEELKPDNRKQLEAPKTARECLQDGDCRKRFTALLSELGITDDKPYLAMLKVSRYSEYAGTFDELCQEMRAIHETFNMPTPDPEDDAEPAADMTGPEAAQLLGKGDKTPIGREPVVTKDPVEDAALNQEAEKIADGLAASKAVPLPAGKSPFASSDDTAGEVMVNGAKVAVPAPPF